MNEIKRGWTSISDDRLVLLLEETQRNDRLNLQYRRFKLHELAHGPVVSILHEIIYVKKCRQDGCHGCSQWKVNAIGRSIQSKYC